MPYRKFYRKRFPKRRRRFAKKAGGWGWNNAWSMAKSAWNTASYLKGLINVEKLAYDTNPTTAISSTAQFNALCTPAQGDTVSGRTGNSILVKSVLIRSFLQIHTDAICSVVRFIVFYDTESANAAPGTTDILAGNGYNQPLSLTHPGRFVILYDKMVLMDDAYRQGSVHKIYVKTNFHIKFSANNGTVADYAKNGLFLMLISNEATNTIAQNTVTRVRYIDN